MKTSIRNTIARFAARHLPWLAAELARPLAGVALTRLQIQALNDYGINALRIGFRRDVQAVVQRVFWGDWECDGLLPPDALPHFPRDALSLLRTGEHSFTIRGGAAYQTLSPERLEMLLNAAIESAGERVRFARGKLIRGGSLA